MTLLPHRRKLKEGKEWIFTPLRYATEFIDYQFSLSAFFFYGLRCFVSCQKKLHISTSRFSEHLFILYFTSCSSVLAIYHLFLFPIIYTVYSLSLFLGCCYKLSDLFFPSLYWTSISISGKWVLFCVHNFHWVQFYLVPPSYTIVRENIF